MPKPQDIFQLAQQEAVRVTASPQARQSFLYTAAHNYHTTYLNQLLIHAQRPDAAACASMEYWNTKANRLVMRGSRSITVLQVQPSPRTFCFCKSAGGSWSRTRRGFMWARLQAAFR